MKKLPFKRLSAGKYILLIAIIINGIAQDQLTKFLSVRYLKPVHTVPLIEDVLHLTYVENRGAAFGMLSDSRWVFMIISTVAISAFLVLLFSGILPNTLYEVSLAMIISGGIGNMIDRIYNGFVVDFIDFRLIDFAVFNGADSFVCVGAGILCLALILDIFKDSKNKKEDTNASNNGQ